MTETKPEWMEDAEYVEVDETELPKSADTTEEPSEPEAKKPQPPEESGKDSNVKLKEVVYRRAGPLEVGTIAKFIKKARPNQYGSLFGEEDDAKGVARLLDLCTNHLLLIAERSGSVLGAMGVWLGEWDWGRGVLFDTDFLVCVPQWQDRGLGLGLIEFAEQIADTYEKPLCLTVHSNVKPEAKSRWFEMRGYKYMGSAYVRLPNGQAQATDTDDSDG